MEKEKRSARRGDDSEFFARSARNRKVQEEDWEEEEFYSDEKYEDSSDDFEDEYDEEYESEETYESEEYEDEIPEKSDSDEKDELRAEDRTGDEEEDYIYIPVKPENRRKPVRRDMPKREGNRNGAGRDRSSDRSRPQKKRPERSRDREDERENRRKNADRNEAAAKKRTANKKSERENEKKKGSGLLAVLGILMILLIGLLVFLVWQMQQSKNNTPEIPNLIEKYTTEANVETAAQEQTAAPLEEGNGEPQPVDTASKEIIPTTAVPVTMEPQTYQNDANGNMIIPERQAGSFETEPAWVYNQPVSGDRVLDEAYRLAAMYDYDTAIASLKAMPGYETIPAYAEAVASFETQKSEAGAYAAMSTIPHIFFHTLVVDTSRAFNVETAISPQDGTCKVNDYNYVMTTIDEFCRILEEMYNRGYVLVSIYDIASYKDNGDGTRTMSYNPIYLPAGKKPFVLSVDDVSYYEYMTNYQGYPSKLVVSEDGKIVNEYLNPDGTVSYGAYDVVPILDDFIETHPDFSYKGAKGIIALTGYEGILGYRTCDFWYNWSQAPINYAGKDLSERRQKMYYNNENIEADKAAAKAVAEAIKADGWLFASHTWGHNKVGDSNVYDFFKWDADMWEKEVEPLIGETDIIIFPQGEDLYQGCWRGYDPANEKYQYLKSCGFDYFCNVDSNLGWTQLGNDYYRMARANLDGQRMWEAISSYHDPAGGAVDRIAELFDSRVIFDWSRPTPVTK